MYPHHTLLKYRNIKQPNGHQDFLRYDLAANQLNHLISLIMSTSRQHISNQRTAK